jgi:OOP family OmpA-OmpF porin
MRPAVIAALFLVHTAAGVAQETTGIKAFSKYDFVPGERVVAFYDFMADAVGDFPAGWDTNASGEVVTIEGKPGQWLTFTNGGVFIPDLPVALPDNFTLEFDVLTNTPYTAGVNMSASLVSLSNVRQPAAWQGADNRFTFTVHPTGLSAADRRQDGTGESAVNAEAAGIAPGDVIHVSVWRQKQRVRVYFNEQKIWDLPRALVPEPGLNSIVFYVYAVDPSYRFYISNVRLAVGAPDTRSKLVTEGRFVTHGILFDVNSDKLRGESYGTLKEIAAVLTATPDLKVKIVGHTDSDGDAAANLDLSKRRAASVKAALAAEFGIDAARMETDGMGETEPADSNDTTAGKANNRRVEFIRM